MKKWWMKLKMVRIRITLIYAAIATIGFTLLIVGTTWETTIIWADFVLIFLAILGSCFGVLLFSVVVWMLMDKLALGLRHIAQKLFRARRKNENTASTGNDIDEDEEERAEALAALFSNFRRYDGTGISKKEFQKLNFRKCGNLYYSDGLCTGAWNKTDFRVASVSSCKVYCEGWDRYDWDIFRDKIFFDGTWLDFPYEREAIMGTSGELLVIPNTFCAEEKQKARKLSFRNRRHKVLTENSAFDKKFTCLTRDSIFPRAYLNDKMIAGIRRLEKEYDGQLMFAFANDRIYVLYNDHDKCVHFREDGRISDCYGRETNQLINSEQLLLVQKMIDMVYPENVPVNDNCIVYEKLKPLQKSEKRAKRKAAR